jgi:putative glutamine amidotransferase
VQSLSAPFYIFWGRKMTDPLIGVTTYQVANAQGHIISALLRAYTDAVLLAGGIPLLIPSSFPEEHAQALVKRLDGILFTGGGDISLERFNGEPHPSIDGVDPERDSIELALLKIVIEEEKPFLGICRGFQLINIGLGGTLYTHISDQKPGALKHDYYPNYLRNYPAHEVELVSGTQLRTIFDTKNILVNSLHHQGAKDIPGGLVRAGVAPDGLVEAIELANHPYGLAVQWHPEWLTDQPTNAKLFKSFVEAARTII